MKAYLLALLGMIAPVHADVSKSHRVRAEVWEVDPITWAKVLDTVKNPEAWRHSLLQSSSSRLAGTWVLHARETSWVDASRERIYPVEYPSEMGLEEAGTQVPPPSPIRDASPLGFFKFLLTAKSFRDFEVRDEGWRFSTRCEETPDGSCRVNIKISEVVLLEYARFSSNPLSTTLPDFSYFSMDVTRIVEPGKWEIFASQAAPRRPDGTRSGTQRVLLVQCIRESSVPNTQQPESR